MATPFQSAPFPTLTPYLTQVQTSFNSGAALLMYLTAGVVTGVVTNKATSWVKARSGTVTGVKEILIQAAIVTFCLALVQSVAVAYLPTQQQSTGALLFVSMFLITQTTLHDTIAQLQKQPVIVL